MAGSLISKLRHLFAGAAIAVAGGAGIYAVDKMSEPPEKPKDNTELSGGPGKLSNQHARASDPAASGQKRQNPAAGTALSSRGQNYAVPPAYKAAIKDVTKKTPALYDVMVQLLGSEGGFKADAVSETGAFSAAQFVGTTYYEALYKNAKDFDAKTAKIITDNVERHDSVNRANPANKTVPPKYEYRLIPEIRDNRGRITQYGGNEKAILKLAEKPEIITKLAHAYMLDSLESGEMRYRRNLSSEIERLKEKGADMRRIKEMERQIERPMTSADLKTMYVGGARGGTKLLVAHADPHNRDKPAAIFTEEKVVKANPNVFYHKDKTPKTLAEYHDYIVQRVGDIVIPKTESRMTPEQIKANQKLSEANKSGPTRSM